MIDAIRRRRGVQLAGLVLPGAFWVVVFFLAPLMIILLYSFLTRGSNGEVVWAPTLAPYAKLLSNPDFVLIFVRSFYWAFLTTIVCLLIGYPFAFYLARQPARWRVLMVFLIMIPFWTNFLVRTYAWKFILNNNGLINVVLKNFGLEPLALINTPTAVLIGLVYGELPFMVLPLYAAIEKFNFSLIEAAQDLGASIWASFFRVLLPLTAPGIAAGCVLVFIPSVGAYVIPDILGGGKVAMLGNILDQQFGSASDWPFGSAIGVVFMILLMVGVLIYFRVAPEEVR